MIIEIEESAEMLWTEIQGASGPSKKLFMKVIGKYLEEWIAARRLRIDYEKQTEIIRIMREGLELLSNHRPGCNCDCMDHDGLYREALEAAQAVARGGEK